jgi:hypothetical protein
MGERTARVLSSRLEALAVTAERSGADAHLVARLLEAASVATMNAVALDLLTDAAARETWRPVQLDQPVVVELRDAA